MSMETITRDIAFDAAKLFNNRDIKAKHIIEWNSGEIKPGDGEVTLRIPHEPGYRYCGIWLTVEKKLDKREPAKPAPKSDPIALQNAEFDAVKELAEQWRRITLTPVVDDDYPEVRHCYEGAIVRVLRAAKANGRAM